ncbi:Adipocyte plasma membrane-associated protein [Porphyridium purpureum]|uniref:Adipocyte plasma membrane-associated protein n=1 Tax=Porphyridium purpureum TaxID=35688 RepID=A0A5J4Z1D5_PORPP|nr:Adipocyte plasma membrane-associated protein [Porphyridium purpureum]|eukprot:POR8896..scf208_2
MGFWDTVTQEWKYRLLMFVSPAVLSMLIMFINAPAPFMIEPQVVPLDITRYEPLEGVFAPNLALQAVIAVGQDVLRSPEAMFASPDGKVYTIDDRAILYQIKSLRGSSEYAVEQVHAFGQANGRNLGGEFRSDGSLVLCNVPRGLFLFNLTTKKMTLLTDTVTVEEGKPPSRIFHANDLAVSADDQRVFFSDSVNYTLQGRVNPFHVSKMNAFEGVPRGRLLMYDFESNTTSELMSGLYFANGVALSKDEDFVLVAECFASRIHRLWLTGPKAGQVDIFARLPGFTDNLNRSPDGLSFWVAVTAPDPALWPILREQTKLRKHLSKLPQRWSPGPSRHGLVVNLDARSGEPRYSLQDPHGYISSITSAIEVDDKLYLGTIGLYFCGVLEDLRKVTRSVI